MTFTEEDIEEVKERAAQILADKAEEGIVEAFAKTLPECTVFSVAVAAQMAGISTQFARKIFPIVEWEQGPNGVQLSDILQSINDRKNK